MSTCIPSDPHQDLSTGDLVSWTFGNHDYDQDKKLYVHTDDPEQSLSALQARKIVRQLVAGFQAKGLKPGDCVCVYAFSDVLYSMLVLGIVGAGGRFTGCNPAYTASELVHQVKLTNAKFLVTEPELLPKVATAVEALAISPSRVFVLDNTGQEVPPSWSPIQELLKHGETDWVQFRTAEEAKNTTAALLLTSGTTGLPKAAMISHYSFVTMNILLNESARKPYNVSRLISLPMFHVYAFPLVHISPLREGVPTHIMRRFNLARYVTLIEECEITETPMVPAMINSIVRNSSISKSSLQSLRLVWSAGAVLDEKLQDQMYRLLEPSARVVQVWGMTELGYITAFPWPESDHTGSVGRLLPGIEAMLVAEDGRIVSEDHEEGEIFVKSPLLMQGYLGNAEASGDTINADGWFKTGDIGYTEHGKFYIVDRKKEMIKVRGWQVSPAELEAVLIRHPDILEAAVIGINPPNSTDEAPRAYIVKKPDSGLDETTIKNHMLLYLAKYKALDGGIIFIGSIPRTPTGKVSKKVLKERAEKESQETLIKDIILSAISTSGRSGLPESPDSANTFESGRASFEQRSSLASSEYIEVETEADDHQLKATATTRSVDNNAEGDGTNGAPWKPNNNNSTGGNGAVSESTHQRSVEGH